MRFVIFKAALNILLSASFVMLSQGVIVAQGVIVSDRQPEALFEIAEGEVWHYFKGSDAPPSKWKQVHFDDSRWLSGPSGFGYGDGMYNTPLDDMRNNYASVFVRREFLLNNTAEVTGMTLFIECGGAFKAYLNGIEVIRSDIPFAEELDISGFIHELHSRANVIAIECQNNDISSRRFNFIPFFWID